MWNLDFAHNAFSGPGRRDSRSLCSWVRRNADRGVFADRHGHRLAAAALQQRVDRLPPAVRGRRSARAHAPSVRAARRARARRLPVRVLRARVRADFVVLHKQHCAHKVGDGSRFAQRRRPRLGGAGQRARTRLALRDGVRVPRRRQAAVLRPRAPHQAPLGAPRARAQRAARAARRATSTG
jgi:hypothetical protein